jgi:asparagine synthase (glutamine-hydrolysing)
VDTGLRRCDDSLFNSLLIQGPLLCSNNNHLQLDMCGIAGLIDPDGGDRARLIALAQAMADTLAHRGPDDRGAWVSEEAPLAFGHRRLSVLDLSPAGDQPMHSASGRYVIAFNGEIYNHAELRRELEQTGRAPAWRGHSDTEVMLAAFEAWGVEPAIQRFTGMFAIALWDRHERRLHLARDRLGEKPLYYGWQGKAFLFASELKAFHAHPAFRGEIDRDALALLLRHGYVPAPHAIWRDVRKLPPGMLLTLTADAPASRDDVAPRPYWSAMDTALRGIASPLALPDEEAATQLEALLSSAIGGQMVADVPLGAFLSGGIDSSTVVALMQAQSTRPVRTFSIGFNEPGYNEAQHAAAVAAHLGTEHTELYVTAQDALAVVPRLPALYDEPFADPSQLPTFLVAQLARRHVTVSLSGDGGDELFGGYNRYLLCRRLWRAMQRLPAAVRAGGARLLTAVRPDRWDALFQAVNLGLPARWRQMNAGDRLHKLAGILRARAPEEIYLGLVSHWPQPEEVVIGAAEPRTALTDPARWPAIDDMTARMMALDLVTYLPDDILVKVDRAAMGVSLETRVPLLDHRVVEFAWRLPMSQKIRGGESKWLLRQVLYKHVPKALLDRPKMGFGVPIDAWLRGPLREWAEALLDGRRLAREGYFHPAPVREKWSEHLSARRNWQYPLWNVLMFQAWLEARR